jgi:hypothetical protein
MKGLGGPIKIKPLTEMAYLWLVYLHHITEAERQRAAARSARSRVGRIAAIYGETSFLPTLTSVNSSLRESKRIRMKNAYDEDNGAP